MVTIKDLNSNYTVNISYLASLNAADQKLLKAEGSENILFGDLTRCNNVLPWKPLKLN